VPNYSDPGGDAVLSDGEIFSVVFLKNNTCFGVWPRHSELLL